MFSKCELHVLRGYIVAGHKKIVLNMVERFGLTHLSQAAIIGMTAMSLAAVALSVSQSLMQDSHHANSSSSSRQQFPAVDLNLVSQAHLFGAIGKGAAPSSEQLPSTQLQWVLQGVFTGADPTSGSAIILAGEQKAQLYNSGQRLPGGAQLTEVHADHVVINVDGHLETLRFPTISSSFTEPTPPTPSQAEPVMSVAGDSVSQRREIVRQRLEMLRQRALSRP
jgi:type II secretory pathway component PulC